MGRPWTTKEKIEQQVNRIERNLTTLHGHIRELRDYYGEDVDKDFEYIDCMRCILDRIVERRNVEVKN